MAANTAQTPEMGTAELIATRQRLQATDRLLLWRIVQDGGVSDELLQLTGSSEEELRQFLESNAELYGEYRNLATAGQMLDLQDLYELARVKLSQMLADCARPAELRTLLGCLRLLPGSKALQAACERASAESERMIEEVASLPQADGQGQAQQTRVLCEELQQQLAGTELNRQQRRSLERALRKAQREGRATMPFQAGVEPQARHTSCWM